MQFCSVLRGFNITMHTLVKYFDKFLISLWMCRVSRPSIRAGKGKLKFFIKIRHWNFIYYNLNKRNYVCLSVSCFVFWKRIFLCIAIHQDQNAFHWLFYSSRPLAPPRSSLTAPSLKKANYLIISRRLSTYRWVRRYHDKSWEKMFRRSFQFLFSNRLALDIQK